MQNIFRKNKKAFTLIEILAVIVLIWIVSTITFLDFWTQSPKARNATRLDTSAKVRLAYQIANLETPEKFRNCNTVWASLITYSWRTSQGCNVKIDWSSSWQLFLKSLNISTTLKDPSSPPDYEFTYIKNSWKYEFAYEKENENPIVWYNPISSYALDYNSTDWKILMVDWNYAANTMSWFYVITPINVLDTTKYPLTPHAVTTDSWTNITTILPSDLSESWSYAYYLKTVLHNSEETTNSRLALIRQLWFPISISDLVDNSNNCSNWNGLVFSGWIWQCWAWSPVNRSSYIDADDTNYYVDPNGTSVLSWATISNLNISHTLTLGNWSILNSSTGSNFLIWQTYLLWQNNYLSWALYDLNDSSYYLNPNWTSNLNHLNLWNGSILNSSTGSNFLSGSTFINGSLYLNWESYDANNNTGTLNVNHLNIGNWSILNSSTGSNFLVWPTYLIWQNNYLSGALYDLNDPSYYIDPNKLSNFANVSIWNWTVINNSTDWSNTFSGTTNFNWSVYMNWFSNYLNWVLYDSNDVNFYLDPNLSSILNHLYLGNWSVLNNASDWSNTLAWTTTVTWPIHLNWNWNYLSWALIDANNNSYYLDPNLTSNLNNVTNQGNISVWWTTQMTGLVWINTTPSTYNLSVNGTSNFTGGLTTINWSWSLKYADTNQGVWKVLTSDANGVAKWSSQSLSILRTDTIDFDTPHSTTLTYTFSNSPSGATFFSINLQGDCENSQNPRQNRVDWYYPISVIWTNLSIRRSNTIQANSYWQHNTRTFTFSSTPTFVQYCDDWISERAHISWFVIWYWPWS